MLTGGLNSQTYQLTLTASTLSERYLSVPGAADQAEQNAGESSAGAYAPNPVHELFIRDLASISASMVPALAGKIFGVLYQSQQMSKQAGSEGMAHAMRAQAQQLLRQIGEKHKEMLRTLAQRKAERLNFIAISKFGERTAQRMFGASIAGSKGLSGQLRDSMTQLAFDYNSTPADPYVNIVNAVS